MPFTFVMGKVTEAGMSIASVAHLQTASKRGWHIVGVADIALGQPPLHEVHYGSRDVQGPPVTTGGWVMETCDLHSLLPQ